MFLLIAAVIQIAAASKFHYSLHLLNNSHPSLKAIANTFDAAFSSKDGSLLSPSNEKYMSQISSNIPSQYFQTPSDSLETLFFKATSLLMTENTADSASLLATILIYYSNNIPDAFKILSRLNEHSSRSLRLLASIHAIRSEYPKALIYYSIAASQGDPESNNILAYWHHTGISVYKDCSSALPYYKTAAEFIIQIYQSGPFGGMETPALKHRLTDDFGGVYGHSASGPGSPQKHSPSVTHQETVREIFEINADNGDTGTQVELATLYYYGSKYTPRNYEKAFKYFLKASKSYTGVYPDSPSESLLKRIQLAGQACGYIGRMYVRGEHIQEDIPTALKWLQRGKELRDAKSVSLLGRMYKYGFGVEKDLKKGLQLLFEAANVEDIDALVEIAETGLSFVPFISSNLEPNNAASKSHPMAMYRLAEIYSTPANYQCETAVSYYKSLLDKYDYFDTLSLKMENSSTYGFVIDAEKGLEILQSNAAWKLESEGLHEEAIVLWNRAANQGNVDARVKMGDYHYYGIGLKVFGNVSEFNGLLWKDYLPKWSLEFLKGDIGVVLNDLIEHFVPKPTSNPDFEKAAMYYLLAAEEHSAMAQYNMGYMYEYGVGVKQDLHLAKRMYDLSMETNPESYVPNLIGSSRTAFKMWLKTFDVKKTVAEVPEFLKGEEKEGDSYLLELLIVFVICLLIGFLMVYKNRVRAEVNLATQPQTTATTGNISDNNPQANEDLNRIDG